MIPERRMHLQLFAGEKTEKATPKKRREAREKGQVLKSMEINSAISLLAIFGLLRLAFPFMVRNLQALFIHSMTLDAALDELFTVNGLRLMTMDSVARSAFIVAPVFGTALLTGLMINYAQVGFLFTTKTLAVKLERINPLEGFKRIFSKRALVELLKSLIKLSIVGGVVYMEFMRNIESIPALANHPLTAGAAFIGNAGLNIGFKSAAALLVLALFDYLYQWWDHEKNLMMSKQDIKDEYKQSEGDPLIRSKIKEKQREMGMRRMMQEIPKADVIITNPTHFAVALKYSPGTDEAPKVIAKGQDYVAQKIKELAKESDVTIVENKPLAQALYKTTEIGSQVPEELFHAVAEVLAFVYSLNQSKKR